MEDERPIWTEQKTRWRMVNEHDVRSTEGTHWVNDLVIDVWANHIQNKVNNEAQATRLWCPSTQLSRVLVRGDGKRCRRKGTRELE